MHTNDRRTDLLLSAHGRRRAAARGFSYAVMTSLADIADREVPVGRGCVALSASTGAIASAREDGLAPEALERLRGRVLVMDNDGVVVTALVRHRRRGRHYLRDGRAGSQNARRRLAGRGR
jgi:hypothetical protein